MKSQSVMFYIFLYLASKQDLALSEKVNVHTSVDARRDQEHRLIQKLFGRYEPSFLPRLNDSQAVRLQFAFELISIKEVSAKYQFISVYGWVRQSWFNPLLQWNVSEFGGIRHIMVNANRVWVPDILLYNNRDVQDRIGGGKETYKTEVTLTPAGKNYWYSPAIFNCLCNIDVTYFPFDVQTCALKFGSWSLNSARLTMVPENMTSQSPNYVHNGEWQLVGTKFKRNVVAYAGGIGEYDDLTLTIEIGRNYFTYFVNLVLPCTVISSMVFLSFLLPPACGERISLGITVLLAMTVFQQLSSQLFPSFDIPLLGQYYIATGLEISLALVATTMVINLGFKGNTQMPAWMRKLILCRLATMVRLRKAIEKSRPKARGKFVQCRKTANETNQPSSQPEERREDRLVQELPNGMKVRRQQSRDYGAFLFTTQTRTAAENLKPNGSCGRSTNAASSEQHDTREDAIELQTRVETGVLDEKGEELNEAELALRQWEWSMAASVLDRTILWLSVITGVLTFLGIFLQAPKVRELIFSS